MATIPHDKYIDSTLPLVRTGYTFLKSRFEQFQSDIFQMRLLGEKTVCIHGEEAAKVFYDQEYFKRKGAIPKRIQKSLFGQKTVQSLDGEAHRNRKDVFMSLMSPENMDRLMDLNRKQWESHISKWQKEKGLIVLFEEAQQILLRAICEWTGIPLKEEEVKFRAEDLEARIDSFGAVGPRYWRGRFALPRTEKWIGGIIEKVRAGILKVPEEKAVYVFASHRDVNGDLLDTNIAAAELLNVIRPFVAVAYYIVFSALALHEFPEQAQKLKEEGEEYAHLFVQEVRRYYPFVPLLGARVSKEFDWKGHHFDEGRLVLLDIYGTLHDERLWEQANEFNPERFKNWKESPFDFIPQGGGDHYRNHRCAGEWITIGAAKVALQQLAGLHYEVPAQNLKFSLRRMPTYPKSGFTIRNIKKRGEEAYIERAARQRTVAERAAIERAAAAAGCPVHQKPKENSREKNS